MRNRVIGNLRARLRKFEEEMVDIPCNNAPVLRQAQDTPSLPKRGEGELLSPPLRGGAEGRQVPPLGGKRALGGIMSLYPFMRLHLREDNVRQLRQTLASYLGHFKHADSHRLLRGLFGKYQYLKDIFIVDEQGKLIPLYHPPFEPVNMRGQYNWAIKQYPDYCIFFQVGKFCEFYGEQAERYGSFFSLTMQPAMRNLQLTQCGFPVRYLKEFKKKTRATGLPYVVIGERGYYPSGLKKRVVTEIGKALRLIQE